MFIATMIASAGLQSGQISEAADRLNDAGCAPRDWSWIEFGEAADIPFSADPIAARAAIEGVHPATDVIVQPELNRAKRLLVADMDSTMITVECIDELADYAGIKPQIAEVTERAMRGELDFAAALDERVALLAGLEESVIERCLHERVTITPGAIALVRTMRARGATAILISGGFTRFAEPVAARIGFNRSIANVLDIVDGRLSGTVARPIVDAVVKRRTLDEASMALDRSQTLAVGDGANDLPMIEGAGLGVAFRAKPVVARAAAARIDHNDLTALLYAQGWSRRDWTAG